MHTNLDVEKPSLDVIKPQTKQTLQGEECACFEKALNGRNEDHELLTITSLIPGAFFIDNVLNKDECQLLCLLVDENPALSFWCKGKNGDENTQAFRNVQTIELHSEDFANIIWSRICNLFEINLEFDINIMDDLSPDFERELVGQWRPCGLNADSLFAKYPSHGSFAPHTDGRAILDFNHRSHYSVIIYLNSIPLDQGGGTRFYHKDALQALQMHKSGDKKVWTADESFVLGTAEAVAGRFLFFHQSLVHEGVPPITPYDKVIIRSDIIYERTPPICDSVVDREAYQWYRKGEVLVEQGEVDEGIKHFRKAFKMSPGLAVAMGQG